MTFSEVMTGRWGWLLAHETHAPRSHRVIGF